MSARKTKNRTGVAALLVGALALFGGTFAYVKFTDANQVPLSERREATSQGSAVNRAGKSGGAENSANQDDGGKPVQTISPSYPADGEKLELTRNNGKVPAGQSKFVYAVNKFLENAKITPPGAQLVSAKMDSHGELTMNFSPEFEKTYGTEDEKTLLNGIIASVSQFEGVKTLVFKVDGHTLDTLGNIDLSQPLPAEKL